MRESICRHRARRNENGTSPLFVFKVVSDFEKVYGRRGQSLSVCLSVCLCVMSLASDSSETIEVIIIIKLGMVTASHRIIMHHVLIILKLTFIQGHTDLNHE